MIKKLRASSLPALAKCGLWKSKPFDTALTKMGNDRHEALEHAVKNNDRTKLDALPAEEAEGVNWAINYVRANTSNTWPMEWEESGTLHVDGITVTGRWDLVNGPSGFDLKNQLPSDGKSYLPQLALYACMIMHRDGLKNFTYHVMYAAPKVAKVHEFTLEEAENIIGETVANAVKAEATPCSYCSWCDRAATCEALNQTAQKVSESFSNELAAYDPKDLTDPVNLSRALTFSRALKPWMEEVERLAKEHALSGGELVGFQLKQRAANTRVKDLNGAFNAVGLPAEDFMGCCSITLGKLYDAFASAKGITKAEAKRECQELLAEHLQPKTYIKFLTKSK